MASNKDMRQLVRQMRAQGWEVSRTRSDHLRFTSPDGHSTVYAPSTPSDHRSIRNVVAKLRREGAQL